MDPALQRQGLFLEHLGGNIGFLVFYNATL
jgi:hypothetical protein